jgi:hypothetical protein
MNADYVIGLYQLSAVVALYGGTLLTIVFQRWNSGHAVVY